MNHMEKPKFQADTHQDAQGNIWYGPNYVTLMMSREYERGKQEGQKTVIHVAEIQMINQKEK